MPWLTNIMRGFLDETADELVLKALKDKYTDNLLGMASVVKRMGFFPAMELWMRAVQGTLPERPLGTNLHLSRWEELLFNPVHLHRLPVDDQEKLDTSVVVGPLAARPLHLKIPVFITGMSYGSALSKKAKVALAKAASVMGTATNTGEAGLLEEEREAAEKLIGQYNRGGYLNTPDKYKQLDAIEIQLGQGAQGPSPQRTAAKFIDQEMREVFGLAENEPAVLHSRLPGVSSAGEFRELVQRLKEDTAVPVGVKFAASHYLERELEIAVEAGVDFVTVDGAEGATHGASPTLEDDVGLPTMYAIARARRWLDAQDQRGRVTLVAGGGLFTPGQFLKALALGAEAVYTGTAAVTALVAQQVNRVSPSEPPMQMVLNANHLKDRFDVDLGTAGVVNYLSVAVEEMKSVLYAIGKASVRDLSPEDLVCLDPWLARALHLPYGGVSPAEQEAFYRAMPVGDWVSPAREPEPVGVH